MFGVGETQKEEVRVKEQQDGIKEEKNRPKMKKKCGRKWRNWKIKEKRNIKKKGMRNLKGLGKKKLKEGGTRDESGRRRRTNKEEEGR